jgi:hypothetical protein
MNNWGRRIGFCTEIEHTSIEIPLIVSLTMRSILGNVDVTHVGQGQKDITNDNFDSEKITSVFKWIRKL